MQGQSVYEKEMWKYRKSQSSWWLLSRIVFNTQKGIRPQTQETQNPSMEEWRWAWSPIPSWETFDIWLLLEEAIESQLFYWPHSRTRVAPRNSQSDWVERCWVSRKMERIWQDLVGILSNMIKTHSMHSMELQRINKSIT